jgi:hypothetical protein
MKQSQGEVHRLGIINQSIERAISMAKYSKNINTKKNGKQIRLSRKLYSILIMIILFSSSLSTWLFVNNSDMAFAENVLTDLTNISGQNQGDNLGWNVSWVGDVNGDGFDDIVVGAPNAERTVADGHWWNASWLYRKRLTFDNQGVTKDMANFPVMVNLSSSNFNYSKARINGEDLRFIDSDGSTQLKYHYEIWNTSGNSYIWVNVTNISPKPSSDYIWLYYGNSGALDNQDESGTYDSEFKGVWHLSETGSGTRFDSTSNNYDGIPGNYDGDESSTGKIGGADRFWDNDEHITMSSMNPQVWNDFTVEGWYRSNLDTLSDDGYIYADIEAYGDGPGIILSVTDDSGDSGSIRAVIYDNDINTAKYYGTSNVVDRQFHFLVLVRENGRIKLYVDGVLENDEIDDHAFETINVDTLEGPYIGDFPSASENADGIVDEVRVSNIARSSDWIAAQYLSMNDDFITFGNEELLINDTGAAYIFFGHLGFGLSDLDTKNANMRIFGSNIGDLFGWSVARAGNINFDGYNDIIIGAPGYESGKGRAYVFLGKPTTAWSDNSNADDYADLILTGENSGDKFGFSLSEADSPDTLIYDPNWGFRKKITFDSTKVAGNLSDFPVLISITDPDLQSKAQLNGNDILFTSSDGVTKLDHEIESYNQGTGELIAWIKVPFLAADSDTSIYMYYNNSDANNQQNTQDVWSDDFRGVWHLSESSGNAMDSTSYNTAGDVRGNVNQGVSGKIGSSYEFDPSDGQIEVGDPADGHLDFGIGSFTLSVWVKDYIYNDYQNIIYKGALSVGDPGYSIYHRSDDGMASLSLGDTIAREKIDFDYTQDGSWRYIVGVVDRTNNEMSVFLNGVQQGTSIDISSIGSVDNGEIFHISGGSNNYLNGFADEARVAAKVRSADWIETSYNNQNDPSSFYSIDTEEPTNSQFKNLIVGAYGHNNDRGRAYVFSGSSVISGEISAENAFVIINGTNQGDSFGWSVSNSGDNNNDGLNEICVGAPGYNGNMGAVYLIYGNDSIPQFIDAVNADVKIEGGTGGEQFGFSVGFAGDVNFDGYDDIIIGSPGTNSATGSAHIFLGQADLDGLSSVSDADVTFYGESSSDRFGYSVSNAGDIDSDNMDDVLVGAPYNTNGSAFNSGAVYVYQGGTTMNNAVDWFHKGTLLNDHLGWSVSKAGDMNGDDFFEVLVGAPHNDDSGMNSGKVHILTIGGFKPFITNISAQPSPQNAGGYVNITCDVDFFGGFNQVGINITDPNGSLTNYSLIGGAGNEWYYNSTFNVPGVYDFTIWTLDDSGKWNFSLINNFIIVPSSPHDIILISGNDQNGMIGNPLAEPFVVEVRDEFGNLVPDAPVLFNVSFGDGSLDKTNPVLTNSTGEAQIFLTLGVVENLNIVTAEITGSGINQVTFTASGISNKPVISSNVPDIVIGEDDPPYILDLTSYGFDDKDLPGDLRWFITENNNSLYLIGGQGANTLVITPVKDMYGNDNVTIWVYDSDDLWDSQPLWINITPVNDKPYFFPELPDLTITKDIPYTFDYEPYIYDIDNPKSELSLITDDPQHTIVNGHKVTFTYPASMINQDVFVAISVGDGLKSSSEVIQVNISDDNVPILTKELPDVTLYEAEIRYNVFDLDEYFADADEDVVFFSYGYSHLEIIINENQTVDFHAESDWWGTETVIFRARDPSYAIAEDSILVTVLPVNDPPKISNVPDLVVRYDSEYYFDLTPYISDLDNDNIELELSFMEFLNGSWEISQFISVSSENNIGLTALYPVDYLNRTLRVRINVSDGLDISSMVINITVSEDWPPELVMDIPDMVFFEDELVFDYLNVHDYFEDRDNDPLFYTYGQVQTIITIHENGSVDLSAQENWYGTENITIRATDPYNALVEDIVTVTVLPVNDAPSISLIENQVGDKGKVWILDVGDYIDDIDNDQEDLTLSVDSIYVRVVGNILIFTYPESVDSDVITVTVSDGELQSSTSFNITLQDVVKPPSDQSVWDYIIWLVLGGVILQVILLGFAVYKRRKNEAVADEAFLIFEDGRLITHVSTKVDEEVDNDILSSMLTGVTDFISEAFVGKEEKGGEKGLHKLQFGERNILLEKGNRFIIAIVYSGSEDNKLIDKGKQVIENIETNYKYALDNWEGDLDDFEGTEEILETLLPLDKISDEELKEIKERRGRMRILEEWTLRHAKMIQGKLSNSEGPQIEEGGIENNDDGLK